MDCTCDMIWLRAWYQETDSLTHYPGPKCRDGTMLRESRLTRNECQNDGRVNQIPLTNEHGDVFQRRIDFDECENEPYTEFTSNVPPLPGESEYFYDQYVDYPINETNLALSNNESSPINIQTSERPFPTNSQNLSSTILNFNRHKQQQQLMQQPPGSQFTFFGMPLPSLNMGNLWNIGRSANTRSATGTKGKPRVQVYRPDDMDLFKFLNRNPSSRHPTHSQTNRNTTESAAEQADSKTHNFYRPYFQTSFLEPSQAEKGGFNPMVPGTSGGFRPIHNPYFNESINSTKDLIAIQSDQASSIQETTAVKHWPNDYSDMVPLATSQSPQLDQSTEFSRPIFSVRESSTIKDEFSSPNPNDMTTMTPLQNYLSDINSVPNYQSPEFQDTTSNPISDENEDIIEQATIVTSKNPITTTTAVTPKLASISPTILNSNYKKPYVQHTDPWENLNHSPSSLSALVAPGAQLGVYRSPPGRSTITKVFSSTQTPTAEEYQRTTPIIQSSNQFELNEEPKRQLSSTTTANTTPVIVLPSNEEDNNKWLRKSNMDWYYANYNKTVDDDHFDPGVNRLRSDSGKKAVLNPLVFVLLVVVILLVV